MIWLLIIALAAGLLLLAIIGGSKSGTGKRRSGSSAHAGAVDRDFVTRKWAAIETMTAGTGSSLRDAVSEADKLLDYALRQSGVGGETMGERLKNSGRRFSDLDAIWRAHKVRNALAHEADFDLVPSQAREAVQDFERGLHDLGAL
ncbi:MAG TPA: hypothetical protein VMR75_02510 [Candidatus Saccharimonadales bacterium]|nr:hypothetical protein [Candidatus Saccharimonadales bacterium]